jgi:hypothetical protein
MSASELRKHGFELLANSYACAFFADLSAKAKAHAKTT